MDHNTDLVSPMDHHCHNFSILITIDSIGTSSAIDAILTIR
jgi:hypothetical protein